MMAHRLFLVSNEFSFLNAQIEFFMNLADESEFVAYAEPFADSIDRRSDIQWFLTVGEYQIQLLRSQSFEQVVVCGRISLRTVAGDIGAESVESLFNKLRRWLKKNYDNKLTVRNVNISNSTNVCRTHWVGPNLMLDLQQVDSPKLSQTRNAIVVFEQESSL